MTDNARNDVPAVAENRTSHRNFRRRKPWHQGRGSAQKAQGNKQGKASCKCESGAEMDLLDLQQKRRPQQPQQGKFRHVGHFSNEVVGVGGGNVEQLQQRVENVQDGPAGLGGLGGREEGVPPDKSHAGHSSQAGEKQ